MATRVGSPGYPVPDEATADDFAQKYDILWFYDRLKPSVMHALKAANPNIILIQYVMPGSTLNKTKWPDSYYVKDRASGLKVKNGGGWWLLKLSEPYVRASVIDNIITTASPGVDGYYFDNGHPLYVNAWYVWTDENGKCADLGDLDGGWTCSRPFGAKHDYTDGTWKTYMLNFHDEFTAEVSGKIRIFNGMPSRKSTYDVWQAPYDRYITATDGVRFEEALVKTAGPLPEEDWKWTIDKAKALVAARKYVHFSGKRAWEPQYRRYIFASYLLFADGKYAWYQNYQQNYEAGLFEVDYGTALGPYSTISTPDGPIYKREFSRAIVWVNPGGVTRSYDGKTLSPKSAIIEMK